MYAEVRAARMLRTEPYQRRKRSSDVPASGIVRVYLGTCDRVVINGSAEWEEAD